MSTRSSTAPHSRVSTAELVSTTRRYAARLLHAAEIGIVFIGVCPFVSVLVCLSVCLSLCLSSCRKETVRLLCRAVLAKCNN